MPKVHPLEQILLKDITPPPIGRIFPLPKRRPEDLNSWSSPDEISSFSVLTNRRELPPKPVMPTKKFLSALRELHGHDTLVVQSI
jgi:hypothetical protein